MLPPIAPRQRARLLATTASAVVHETQKERGATSIFLVSNLLTNLHASAYFIQVAYGGVLFIAVLLGARLLRGAATAS